MALNKKQKIFLWVGILALGGMGLYPPWSETFSAQMHGQGGSSVTPLGYNLLFSPPQKPHTSPLYGVRIDTDRLLIQWAIIVAITGGLIATFQPAASGKD